MATRAWGNEYRTTMVSVDAYKNGVISGRLYNPYLDTGQKFSSLMEFLKPMDTVLDKMNFPQSFTAARTFAPAPTLRNEVADPGIRSGKLATFAIKVLFRQNASWQGSVVWVEEEREASFRSALELLKLLDSVLWDAEEKKEEKSVI